MIFKYKTQSKFFLVHHLCHQHPHILKVSSNLGNKQIILSHFRLSENITKGLIAPTSALHPAHHPLNQGAPPSREQSHLLQARSPRGPLDR